MFEAEIRASKLSEALGTVTALVDEAKLQLKEEGIRIKTVDAANVGAVSLTLMETAFRQYHSDNEEIFINVSRVEKILNKTEADSIVKLRLERGEKKLYMLTDKYEFQIALLIPEGVRDGHSPQEIEPPGSVTIGEEELDESLSIATMFSDVIQIGIDPKADQFFMIAEGDNNGMHLTLGQEELIRYDPAVANSRYSLQYLGQMIGAAPAESKVKFELGKEYPAKISFTIADGDGEVEYGVAPRVG
jgi:proliferating cell nuclear antigen